MTLDLFTFDPFPNLTNAQIAALLEWDHDFGGLNPRPMLLAALQNRLTLGRINVDDVRRAA